MTDFRGVKIGLLDEDLTPIRCGDTIEIRSRLYGTYTAPVEYIPAIAGFGAKTYGGQAVQLRMPDRAWDREHAPCECDGAMYEAQAIFHMPKDHPKDTFGPKYLPSVRVVDKKEQNHARV